MLYTNEGQYLSDCLRYELPTRASRSAGVLADGVAVTFGTPLMMDGDNYTPAGDGDESDIVGISLKEIAADAEDRAIVVLSRIATLMEQGVQYGDMDEDAVNAQLLLRHIVVRMGPEFKTLDSSYTDYLSDPDA